MFGDLSQEGTRYFIEYCSVIFSLIRHNFNFLVFKATEQITKCTQSCLELAKMRKCFCTWKDNICERPGFKFTNSTWRPYSTLRRREVIVRSFCGLRKGYLLWQIKPKKGTLRKQLTVNSLPSNLLKKSFFYLHLIHQLIYWLKHFDSRNTYLWHPWQVLRVTGSTENTGMFPLVFEPLENVSHWLFAQKKSSK